jgi:hypothetical protein
MSYLKEEKTKTIPGPGEYKNQLEMNAKGKYFHSRYKSSNCPFFSRKERMPKEITSSLQCENIYLV